MLRSVIFALIVAGIFCSVCMGLQTETVHADQNNFDEYKLLRVIPRTTGQLFYLKNLQKSFEHANNLGVYQVNVWTENLAIGQPASILVSPEHHGALLIELQDMQLEHSLIWSDFQKVINQQSDTKDYDRIHPFNTTMTWEAYHRYPTIEFFMQNLAQRYPDLVQLEKIGITYEGRFVWMIKLGKRRADGTAKPGIWMDSGIHAREWISTASVTFLINELLTNYETTPENRWYLNELDWYVVPVINADGYEHTHTVDRLWRRTRKLDPFTDCIGVDANRNFDFMWQREKPNMDSCSNLYGGPTPFSEFENVAVSDKVLELRDNLKVFMTFHSYGQLWMTPWGYTTNYPKDYEDMHALAINATTKLTSLYGTNYTVGSSADVLYTSSGTSRDFAKGRTPIKYVYTIELRDTGVYEFVLPPDQILPTARETFEGIKVVAARIAEEFSNV